MNSFPPLARGAGFPDADAGLKTAGRRRTHAWTMEPNEAYGKTRTSSSLTRGSLRSHSVSSNSSRSNDSNSTTAGCDCAAATAATAAEVQAAAVQPGSKDGHCRSANTANTAITATAGTSTNAATLPLQDYRLNLSKIVPNATCPRSCRACGRTRSRRRRRSRCSGRTHESLRVFSDRRV